MEGDALGRIASLENGISRMRPPSTRSSPPHTSPAIDDKASSLPPSLPYTYHPLLHPRLPPTTQTLLLGALDILMLLALAGYSILYFFSLKTALRFCGSELLSDAELPYGPRNVTLSQRDLCYGLNVDVHVAGGFAVFMTFVLGLWHLAALVMRVCERVVFGRGGVVGEVPTDQGEYAGVGDEKQTASSAAVSPLPRTTVYPRPSLKSASQRSTDQPRRM
jgi:hypothetical protein